MVWKDFNKLFDKKSELDSVLFKKVVIKYHKLCERKGVIAFILKGLHQQKNQFSRKTIEALKKWVDKERRSEYEYIIAVCKLVRSSKFLSNKENENENNDQPIKLTECWCYRRCDCDHMI